MLILPVSELKKIFEEVKIANRVWIVTHKKSQRRFEVIGHPSIHKFWVNELKKIKSGYKQQGTGKKEKPFPTPVESRISKKQALTLLHRWIELPTDTKRPILQRPIPPKPEIGMPRYITTPVAKVKLRVKKFSETSYHLQAPDKSEYHLILNPDGWRIIRVDGIDHQVIAKGMPKYGDALEELYRYLDTTPPVIVPAGIDVTIHVQPLADLRFLIATIIDSNNEPLYASIEEKGDVKKVLAFEKQLLLKAGYKVKTRLREENPIDVTLRL